MNEQKGECTMNHKKNAGWSGKGFYVALSLCVAMVGAACWYAFSESSGQPELPPNTGQYTETAAATTTATQPKVTATQPPQTVTTTKPRATTTTASTEDAAAAAMLTRRTESTTTTVTAATTARVERPVPPLEGDVLQPFSNGELVKSETTGVWQTHNGVDYAASLGTEVRSIADGTVTAIDRDALWGICVTIAHTDGTVSRTCGLNEGLTVTAGQVLSRGTVIGAVGNTAEVESGMASHLHFELKQNDAYLDPVAYLTAE